MNALSGLRDSTSLPPRQIELLTSFEATFVSLVAERGGVRNAHMHLCRAHTLPDEYLAHADETSIRASNLPLPAKQNLVGNLHQGKAYTEDDLRRRMSFTIARQIALGVTRLDANVDATPDLRDDGLLAIKIALELKELFADRIKIRIAPTPIFGFKVENGEPKRWKVFERAARICDYLSLLPEKDEPATDGRIGFKPHVHRGLQLALELGLEVQFHLDQANNPNERGTERMLEVLEGFEQPRMEGGRPWVWVIHMISPSAYSEIRFAHLLNRLVEQNVGVIVCPSAAVSMRQLRSVDAPTHNSIARVLNLIKAGVPIELGTDNIADVFVPQGDGDMLTEVKIGGHALRMASPSVWASLASGVPLTSIDRAKVGEILYQELQANTAANSEWTSPFK